MFLFATLTPAWIALAVVFNDAIVPPPAREQGIGPALAAALAVETESPPDARLRRCRTLYDQTHFSAPPTLEAWKARAARVRRRILVAAGLWPLPPRTPLSAVIHGRVERGDYTVEKVAFESRPGLFVTGSLYRPLGHGDGPHAAVLTPHGHFTNGRFCTRDDAVVERQIAHGWESRPEAARYHMQARCVQLARMGCVVFHFDMMGYADSRQLPHSAGFGDAQSELNARSSFGIQTWNSIRALDFLADLPDVDPARIGVTGASGGGTQTFILCAIDDRPAAAFPAVMVSAGMQGGCRCENASHLRVGTDNVEFAALFAPRPLALTGANDWTIDIETKGYPELKEVYRLFGHPENVFVKCFPSFEHNYNEVSRELMYAWFNRHLKLGCATPIRERAFTPLRPAELSVFDDEHPRPAPFADPTAAAPPLPPMPTEAPAFEQIVGGALATLIASRLPAPQDVVLVRDRTQRRGPLTTRELVLARAGTEEARPALLITPPSWNGTLVVSVLAGGRAELAAARRADVDGDPFDLHEELLRRGEALLLPEVLLAGVEGGRLPVHEGQHELFAGFTWGYNRTLLAERVHDVLTAIGFARGLGGVSEIHLLGLGAAGGWTILARALAGDAVSRTAASCSWTFAAMTSLDDPNFLPGAARYGGLAGFARLVPRARLLLCGPDRGSVRTTGPSLAAPDFALLDWLEGGP